MNLLYVPRNKVFSSFVRNHKENASDHFLLHKYSYTHKWTFIENYQLTQNGEIILKIVYKIVWNTH